MFLSNKYFIWYHSIISAAKLRQPTGYTEKHHILPKSLGGLNNKENLVRLTAREHFICHHLLVRMTTGGGRAKMLKALWRTSCGRTLTSRQYEIARRACAEAASLYRHTQETKQKISKALKNKPKSEEHKKNTGLSSKGRTWTATESKNPDFGKGAKNANAKNWKITYADGTYVLTSCLKLWCEENKISYTSFGKFTKEGRAYKGLSLQGV